MELKIELSKRPFQIDLHHEVKWFFLSLNNRQFDARFSI